MKADARTPFETASGAGTVSLKLFIDQLLNRKSQMKIHLVGHSTGAILIGHLLTALEGLLPAGAAIESCLLMAPACRVEFFQDKYRPRLGAGASAAVKIKKMRVYNLTDEVEQADQVTPAYNKSLLHLVSNAFEPEPSKLPRPPKSPKDLGRPVLGMQKYEDWIGTNLVDIVYAGPKSEVSRSASHGGFDNDRHTMNDILQHVLGKRPARPFTDDDLDF